LTRQENSKIEAETITIENERKISIAQAEMTLATKKAEYEKNSKIAAIEASQAAKMREAELQKEVEERRLLSETERLRVELVSRATAEYEASKERANAILYQAQKQAEAALYQKQKEAEGLLAIYNAQAEGIKKIMAAFGGDQYAALQYMMIERNIYTQLAKENAAAIQGLSPKITVWNTGADSGKDNNPVADIFKSLPPLLSTIQEQTGIKPPTWLAQMPKDESSLTK